MKNLVLTSLLFLHTCILSLAAVVIIACNVANTIFVTFDGWSDFLAHTPGGDAAFCVMFIVAVVMGAVAVGSFAALVNTIKKAINK